MVRVDSISLICLLLQKCSILSLCVGYVRVLHQENGEEQDQVEQAAAEGIDEDCDGIHIILPLVYLPIWLLVFLLNLLSA